MRKVKYYKCPACGMKYQSLTTWTNHLNKQHPNQIPKGFTPAQYFYYLQTGKDHGTCIVCKNPTRWNEATGKYDRFCENPNCKKEYREVFKKRMIGKYGKATLLDDPTQQRKMLAGKKNSGMYEFEDGGKVEFVSTYEKDFLQMLDKFLHFSSADIMGPSPHTYYYEYKNSEDLENEGKKFYIPDYYIPSINLEIEIKQNTSTHPKILKIDKVKEKEKDAMMKTIRGVRYIKIMDKDYSNFFDLLLKLKEESIGDSSALEFIIEDAESNGEICLESKRSELPDSAFGISSERKFPLDTADHVLSAIKFFNYAKPSEEKELASKIIKAIKKFNIEDDVSFTDKNRFSKYYNMPANEMFENFNPKKIIKGLTNLFNLNKPIETGITGTTYSEILDLGKGYGLYGKPEINKYITLSKVHVDKTNGIISIHNINYKELISRIRDTYKERRLDYIFDRTYKEKDIKRFNAKKLSRSQMKITSLQTPIFFALELTILFKELYDKYKTPLYAHIVKQLYEKTWLQNSDNNNPDTTVQPQYITDRFKKDYILKNYQLEFVMKYPKLKHKLNLDGYILAFEQGLGKTITAVALAEAMSNKIKHVYIVCPNTLMHNWKEEIASYFVNPPECVICGKDKSSSNTKYFITNNEGIKKMLPEIKSSSGNMLIVDEIHNFRNYDGKRTKELLDLKKKLGTHDVLLMSGTPIKALPSEIAPALKLIDPLFTDDAAKAYTNCFKYDSYLAMDIVNNRFGQIMYRKKKDEVLKLPEKRENELKLVIKNSDKYLLKNVKAVVKEIFEDEYSKLEEENKKIIPEFKFNIERYSLASSQQTRSYLSKILYINDVDNNESFGSMHELDQNFIDSFIDNYIANNTTIPKPLIKTLKEYEKKLVWMKRSAMGKAIGRVYPKYRAEMFNALFDENKERIFDMINNNIKKTVIFSQSLPVVKHICDTLNANGIPAVKIVGGVNPTDRSNIINKFKYDESIRVIVATSQSMSTGVTLTCASLMFFFGPPYRSADYEQCCDRIHRIGQDSDVNIYNVTLMSNGKNLSNRMDDILKWSKDMFDAAIDSNIDGGNV